MSFIQSEDGSQPETRLSCSPELLADLQFPVSSYYIPFVIFFSPSTCIQAFLHPPHSMFSRPAFHLDPSFNLLIEIVNSSTLNNNLFIPGFSDLFINQPPVFVNILFQIPKAWLECWLLYPASPATYTVCFLQFRFNQINKPQKFLSWKNANQFRPLHNAFIQKTILNMFHFNFPRALLPIWLVHCLK